MNTQNAKKTETLVEKSMNTQLSNWFILYSKLHRFHWYVKGPHFFTLHEKFEELYNEAAETADAIAVEAALLFCPSGPLQNRLGML